MSKHICELNKFYKGHKHTILRCLKQGTRKKNNNRELELFRLGTQLEYLGEEGERGEISFPDWYAT